MALSSQTARQLRPAARFLAPSASTSTANLSTSTSVSFTSTAPPRAGGGLPPVLDQGQNPILEKTTLYTPFKSPRALSPTEPMYVVPTAEDWEHDPQLAGLGYPQFRGPLKYWSRHLRKPGYPWDDPVQKRNFGETVHPNEHAIFVFGPEPHADVTYKEIAIGLGAFFSFAGLVYLFSKTVAPQDPHSEKEWPHGGLLAEMGGEGHQLLAGNGQYEYSIEEEDE